MIDSFFPSLMIYVKEFMKLGFLEQCLECRSGKWRILQPRIPLSVSRPRVLDFVLCCGCVLPDLAFMLLFSALSRLLSFRFLPDC